MRTRSLAALAALGVAACGGATNTHATGTVDSGAGSGGDPSPFLGTWLCRDVSSFKTTDTGAGLAVEETDRATFALSAGGALTLKIAKLAQATSPVGVDDSGVIDFDAGPDSGALYTLAVSGATATAVSWPAPIPEEAGDVLTYTGGSFVLVGTGATIDMVIAVSAEPGANFDPGTETISGACTRDEADGG